MKYTNFLMKYKLPITFGVPLLFVVIAIILIFSNNTPATKDSSLSTNQDPKTTTYNTSPSLRRNVNTLEQDENALRDRVLQKKEPLPNGLTKNYFNSPIADRLNVITTDAKGEISFQRSVTDPDFPVKLTDYTKNYGQPGWIFKGSKFYGSAARTYIYANLGFALIANPDTGDVYEEQLFDPSRIEDYVKNFGEDLASSSPEQ